MRKIKQKRTRLATSIAILLAGAVGATYCGATFCYNEDTAVSCVASGTHVDDLVLCDGNYSNTGCANTLNAPLYADSTWYKHPNAYVSGGQYPLAMYHPCGGPVHYSNTLNGQSATEIIDCWQWALVDKLGNFSPDTPWTKSYYGVDYNSFPTCSN
jgi:hypothetical protein